MEPEEMHSLRLVPCHHCGELHPAHFKHCPTTGLPLNTGPALIGRTIAGRYRVLGLIGEGGMGAVYVAEHLLLKRKVAIKRLHSDLTGDKKAVARFQREAKAAAAIGHEHIVEVLDMGIGEQGAPFLVMEYVRGASLAQLLADEGPLDEARAVHIVLQVLAALGAVHRRGIIHRDLKPDNILLTRREHEADFVKVVDFGISKVKTDDDDALDLTKTGAMLGTPFYMSAEQARGRKDLDHRVDLYAAGVILFECLTGVLPFDGENYHQLLQAILHGTPPKVTQLRPTLSPWLDEVVSRAIARDRTQRYESASEMARALCRRPLTGVRSLRWDPPLTPRPRVAHFQTTEHDAIAYALPQKSARSGPNALTALTDPGPEHKSEQARDASPPHRTTTPHRTEGYPKEGYTGYTTVNGDRRGDARLSPDSGELLRTGDLAERAHTANPEAWQASNQTTLEPHHPTEPGTDLTPGLSGSLSGTTQVRATLLLGALQHLRASHGKTLATRVLEDLNADLRERLTDGAIIPLSLIPLPDFIELLRAAERRSGGGDGSAAIRIGQAIADRELDTTHRLFLRSANPVRAVQRIPHFFRCYHEGGEVRVERSPTSGWRITVHDVSPDVLIHATMMSGFYRRLLERAGAQRVQSNVVSCRTSGNDHTSTIVRWNTTTIDH